MAPRSQFLTDNSVKIVTWWGELKGIDKVFWRYVNKKGVDEFKILSGESLNFHPYRVHLTTVRSLWMTR